MFIELNAKGSGNNKNWSVRRQPDGVNVAVNDDITTFNRNPVLQGNLTEAQAKKLMKEFNAKRGPEYGFDFRG